MWCESLVIFVLGQSLVFDQFWLDVLLPLGLSNSFGLRKSGAAIFGCICPRGRKDLLVDSLVVGLGQLDVGSSVCVVIGIYMRRDGKFGLEVRLANSRRVLGTLVKRRGTSEEDC